MLNKKSNASPLALLFYFSLLKTKMLSHRLGFKNIGPLCSKHTPGDLLYGFSNDIE